MAHSIKTVYVVHHSHTDIGYTDLQERVIAIQVNYIKTVLSMMRQPEYADFRWNCETLYCVEEFWKQRGGSRRLCPFCQGRQNRYFGQLSELQRSCQCGCIRQASGQMAGQAATVWHKNSHSHGSRCQWLFHGLP